MGREILVHCGALTPLVNVFQIKTMNYHLFFSSVCRRGSIAELNLIGLERPNLRARGCFCRSHQGEFLILAPQCDSS
jgi:hypothetical protein